MAAAVKADPPVRTDRRCATCRGSRAGRVPKTLSIAGRERLRTMLTEDPFCRADCARRHHGCAITDLQPWKAHDKGAIGRDAGWKAA